MSVSSIGLFWDNLKHPQTHVHLCSGTASRIQIEPGRNGVFQLPPHPFHSCIPVRLAATCLLRCRVYYSDRWCAVDGILQSLHRLRITPSRIFIMSSYRSVY